MRESLFVMLGAAVAIVAMLSREALRHRGGLRRVRWFHRYLCLVLGHKWVRVAKPQAQGLFKQGRGCQRCLLWENLEVHLGVRADG